MKKKKIVVKLDPWEENELTIIGISSHEKGYTLTWALNKNLGFSLTRGKDIEMGKTADDQALTFPVFYYKDETRKISHYLIQNRTPEGFLLREWTAIDFLWVIPEKIDESYLKTLTEQLKALPGVQTAFLLNPDEIPNLERLLIE